MGEGFSRGLAAALVVVVAVLVFAVAVVQGLQGRLALEAVAQRLNAQVLAADSATKVLRDWCAEQGLAVDPRIRAVRDQGVVRPPSAETLARLEVSRPDQVRHRFVRLWCGEVLLSEADNWYVPERLTEEMNRRLETTDTPFGIVVESLRPVRRTESVEQLWQLVPPGWERLSRLDLRWWSLTHDGPPGAEDPGQPMFRHVAVLRGGAERWPISEVRETYQSGALRSVRR